MCFGPAEKHAGKWEPHSAAPVGFPAARRGETSLARLRPSARGGGCRRGCERVLLGRHVQGACRPKARPQSQSHWGIIEPGVAVGPVRDSASGRSDDNTVRLAERGPGEHPVVTSDPLKERLRANWRRAMPLRASRSRGIRRRPRDPSEVRALRQLALRIGKRTFGTWIVQVAPRVYRLESRRQTP